MSINLLIASDPKESVVPEHAYNVPEEFENLETCHKQSQRLTETGSLIVEYKKDDIFCSRVFCKNGRMAEIYESLEGLFPPITCISFFSSDEVKIANQHHGIDITVTQEELELAKQTLKNTLANNGNYRDYPWEVLFAQADLRKPEPTQTANVLQRRKRPLS